MIRRILKRTFGRVQLAVGRRLILAAVVAALGASTANAAVTTTALREAVEFVTKKFSKEVAQEGSELFARRLESLAAKHGDDALAAVRKIGPRALQAVDDAGAHGGVALRAMARHGDDGFVWIARRPQAMELAAKYGDDAADALVKHPGIAEGLVRESGEAAVKALRSVDTNHAIMLANLAKEPATAALAKNTQLLGVVAQYGDRAMTFVWNRKGSLTVAVVLAAFLADPKPFIDGTRDLASVVGENVVKPLVDIPGRMAEQAARSMDWTVVAIALIMAGSLLFVWRSYLRQRNSRPAKAEGTS